MEATEKSCWGLQTRKSYLVWKMGKNAAKLLMMTVAYFYKQRKVIWFGKWEKMPQNS
jgi:hypothetical protein